MKEKTFEELIIQLFPNHQLTKDRWSFELIQFSADDLIEFGIKVREETIAECMKIYEDDWGKYTGYKLMEALPTDRIKTEN